MGSADEYERGNWGPAGPVRVVWQQPSAAATFGTKSRLESWDCWVRGKQHERSAWRHLGVRVAKLMEQAQMRR
jgi:hypothetical protein